MKIKKIITLLIIFIMVFNISIAFASSDDYEMGYDAGFKDGQKNIDSGIKVTKAWLDHLDTDYPGDDNLDDPDDYKQGYFEGYADGLEGEGEDIVINYAETLGKALGTIYGTRDYQNNDKSNWKHALPSNKEITAMFNLKMQDSDYRDAFIDSFTTAFQEAYIIAYEKAMFEPIKVTLEQGLKDGEELGELLGKSFGVKDYYEGEDLDFTRNLPSDRIIITEYSLNNDSEEYKEGFLSGFIKAYEEAYNEAYREANINDTLRDEKDAFSNGKAVGVKQGELQATLDYMSKKPNDWKRDLPKDEFIIEEYSLTYQSSNYRDGFISGFYDGYSEGYNKKYKELSQGAGVNKSVSAIVPIAGTSLNSLDNAFNVSIQPGTFYHSVNLSINTTYDASLPVYSRLIKGSDSYKVSILNNSNNLDDKKEILLSFEYYGDKIKGGIYKLVDNRWLYIPSIIEDGVIYTYVKPSSIKSTGSTYSVFVDKEFILFPDARGHWAKDEINTYVRRGIIYGYSDMTFKPERNITRAEFLTLLSRVYNWDIPLYTFNTTVFKDYNEFGNRNGIISYALLNGYIKGYDDGTFKPNDPISYKEIEIIMSRVLGTTEFKWSNIAIDMLYNKKVRSNSFNDMNEKITRAEVVYMLYTTTESMN